MDDLISRQAAIDALEREKTYCTAFRDGYAPINVFEKYNAGLTDGVKALKNLPSAQPDRKEGRWKLEKIYEDEYGNGQFKYICSECGAASYEFSQPYCHRCGAKMKIRKYGGF